MASIKNAKPGEMITFGTYPQTADGTDQTPIQWRILQNTGHDLFLLSEYILDCRQYHNDREPYHSENADITWNDCALRKWLNDAFYQIAFTDPEKELILPTRCTDNGENCPDTQDKVFLLSVGEINELIDKHENHAFRVKRRAVGTPFSKLKKSDGSHLYVYDKKIKENYLIENEHELGCSWWWLRTQGNQLSRAFFVGTQDSLRSYGRVNLMGYGVRPALKLDLRIK